MMQNQGDIDRPTDRFDRRSGRAPVAGPSRKPLGFRAILLAGIILLGGAGGWLLTKQDPETPVVAQVSSEEFPDAIKTLSPEASAKAKSDPRECRMPMGFIAAATPGNPAGGTVRFRVGSYLSPPFVVTDKPQRIAIPNPMPQGGVGLFSVEGEAKGLVVALTPPANMEPVNGTASVRVVFPVDPPCKP